MKTEVNSQWYNQMVEEYQNEIDENDNIYLDFIGNLFYEAKFAVPYTEKNNDRIYGLMSKYFKSCYDE